MGFSSSMMTGLLSANTALSQAQVHNRTASHLESQANILQSQIKSGLGDVEGHQEELEAVKERQTEVQEMQMGALNEASSQLGTALTAEETERTEKNEETSAEDTKDEKIASDKAKNASQKLQEQTSDAKIAPIDYKDGMHIGDETHTNIAISPKHLEKLADDESFAKQYDQQIADMTRIDKDNPTESEDVLSRIWQVDNKGQISHHAVVKDGQAAAAYEATRQNIERAGRSAFGEAFAGTHVTVHTPTQDSDAVGLLISTNV